MKNEKTEKTIDQWQEEHSEMLATAHDLGLELPEELRSDFTDAGAGASICGSIDALIRAHREGKTVLAADDGKEHTATSAASKPAKKQASKKSAPKKAKPKEDESSAETGEKKVASKPAKKAAAKKVAKKKASGNARKAAGTKRVSFAEDAKINWLGKDNPAREGTGKFQRIDNVRKHNGKTVKTFQTTGKGKLGTLGKCVQMGLVKVA